LAGLTHCRASATHDSIHTRSTGGGASFERRHMSPYQRTDSPAAGSWADDHDPGHGQILISRGSFAHPLRVKEEA